MKSQMPVAVETDWESLWAPYDESTYQAVLDHIEPEDIVLDIGAGDLRLSRRMAALCRRVYAIEIKADLCRVFRSEKGDPGLKNIVLIQGDARSMDFPKDVTVGVLLMRHCRHFRLYAHKLKALGAERMITNARWRMGVEMIHLQSKRLPYHLFPMGWYACWCGAVGFKEGPPEQLTPQMDALIHEVVSCPHCEGT